MMSCAVCDKQRNELHEKKSAILPKTKYLACNDCIANGLEPRWMVALALRSGVEVAKRFLSEKKYPGDEISAKEIMI